MKGKLHFLSTDKYQYHDSYTDSPWYAVHQKIRKDTQTHRTGSAEKCLHIDPDDIIPIQMFSERFRFGDFQIFKVPLVNLSHSVVS